MKSQITILAENAINFNDLTEAKALIQREREIADNTGIEILSKFQLFTQSEITNPDHFDYCMERALNVGSARELFEFGESIDQTVFFTIMNPIFIPFTEHLGVEYYKVRYYDRDNDKIFIPIRETNKPCFVSVMPWDIKYHRGYHFLHLLCVPKYPATVEQYEELVSPNFHYNFQGVSDHTPTLELLKEGLRVGVEYWEKHVRIGSGYLEDNWSVTLDSLEAALMEVSHA